MTQLVWIGQHPRITAGVVLGAVLLIGIAFGAEAHIQYRKLR